ncbi:MAG: RecX family transcriptional regulator [Tannerella sp.]|nr:RecX family transcriptional regulator [Tannerella sp.]
MKQRSESELLHLAAAYCSAGERCVAEVRRKLAAAGASPETAGRIVDRLLKERFVDEARFCHSFVNDKFRFNQWGRLRIRYELQRKGIASGTVAEALDGMDEEVYRSSLSDMLEKKKRTIRGSSERDVFLKLYRYACGRGYESTLVAACLKPLFKEGYDVEDGI